MNDFPADLYTEPQPDVDTLANLGPLTGLAGTWTSVGGLDINPKPDGPQQQAFVGCIDCQPIDAQTNGPQLFYGLRYHTHSYTITVTIHPDGTWSDEQDTVLIIPGQAEPFHHTDRNTLRRIGEPAPNPTAGRTKPPGH